MGHVDHLLIGGGIASATAAEALREHGAEGSVVLLGRELDPPYHRPPVTKGYLAGAESKADALIHPDGWWEQQGIELRTRTNVMAIDPQARTVTVQGGEELTYGSALVATGAMIRRLPVDGAQLDGIHYVRALGNADTIRTDVEGVERVALVGGSFIGCEAAATLTAQGKHCTVVMLEDQPLERAIGADAGARIRRVLESHGVEVVGGASVERFAGSERVSAVVLADGREIEAGAVVCGVGVTPDVMLARKSGLPIGDLGGVTCTSALAVEGCDGLYAAGDICEYDSVLHGARMRIEHEDVAATQGATAARNMLGADAPYDTVPYFFSDLADWLGLEVVGPPLKWDEEVSVGAEDAWGVWYLAAGRVAGCLSVNGGADLDRARELLRTRAEVSARELG